MQSFQWILIEHLSCRFWRCASLVRGVDRFAASVWQRPTHAVRYRCKFHWRTPFQSYPHFCWKAPCELKRVLVAWKKHNSSWSWVPGVPHLFMLSACSAFHAWSKAETVTFCSIRNFLHRRNVGLFEIVRKKGGWQMTSSLSLQLRSTVPFSCFSSNVLRSLEFVNCLETTKLWLQRVMFLHHNMFLPTGSLFYRKTRLRW